jgi:hypothetical protein
MAEAGFEPAKLLIGQPLSPRSLEAVYQFPTRPEKEAAELRADVWPARPPMFHCAYYRRAPVDL